MPVGRKTLVGKRSRRVTLSCAPVANSVRETATPAKDELEERELFTCSESIQTTSRRSSSPPGSGCSVAEGRGNAWLLTILGLLVAARRRRR